MRLRGRSLPLSAILLSLLWACSSTRTGEGVQQESTDPASLESRASALVARGMPVQAARLYSEAALLRAAGDPAATGDARAAAMLCDTAARGCAGMLVASGDTVDVLLAVRAGGRAVCPEVLSGLRQGRFALPEYVGLLAAESLLAGGDAPGAIEALDAGCLPGGDASSRADLPASVARWAKCVRYAALLETGDLTSATNLRASVSADSVAQSRMLHSLGMWRLRGGAAGWQDALVRSIRYWPAGDIHYSSWLLLREQLLSDSSMADSVADAFYAGGLWNELYDIAMHSPSPPGHVTYLAGRTRDRLGFYGEACELLSGYSERWPSGPDIESALLNLALDRARGGDASGGLAMLDRWEERFRTSPRIGNVPWYRGSILAESGRWEEAIPFFRTTLSSFPSNVTADDCQFHIGLGLFILGRHSEAASELSSFVAARRTSVYAPAARYVLGCALLRSGDSASGESTLRDLASDESAGLPSLFARQFLGLPEAMPQISGDPLGAWVSRSGHPFPPPPVAARRGIALLGAGLRRWAVAEFISAEDSVGGAGMLAPTYLEHHVWERMPSAGWRLASLAPAPWPREVWQLRYPAAWPDQVLRACDETGFDPVLVWAIMRQESMFQPLCASPAGARGLLQLIPSTSEYIAAERGWTDYSPDRLFLPEVSLRFGTAELEATSEEAGGVLETLAAYNGGLHNAKGRWGGGTGGDDLFYCRITFDETRLYADKVCANYLVYRWLYPSFASLVQDRFARPFSLSCPPARNP